jgi:flagellin
MSDITLSRGVRSNLLNLQRTADAVSMTQNKLATGKRVNSALDNPTNFFTASSLSSRAADLGNLLDSMGSGMKTLEAADNGLKSITRTVESMQSTLRQARQDRSFKSTSFTLPTTPTGNIRISGGAVGTTPVSIGLGSTPASATTLNAAAAVSTSAFAGGAVTINGTTANIRGDQAAVATTLTGRSGDFTSNIAAGTFTINGTNVNVRGDQAAIASSRNGTGGSDLAAAAGSANFGMGAGETATVTLTSGSNTSTVNITDASTNDDVTSALAANGFSVTRGSAGLNISRADGASFTIATTGTNATAARAISGQADGTVNNGTTAFAADLSTVLTDIGNAGISGLTATSSGGQIALSLANGNDVTLGGSGPLLNQLGFDSANRLSDNGSNAFDATAATVQADLEAANVAGLTVVNSSGSIQLSLASGADVNLGGSDSVLTAIGFTAGANRTSTNGTEALVSTVDSLVNAINTNSDLTDKVRATNDGGRLRIENLSTEELSVEGTTSAGAINGSTGAANTSRIGGNDTRKNLVTQFNELRTQLDKLSEDASFNGVNLLRGDKLKLTFNENGTSQIDIQAKDAAGVARAINTTSLDITNALTSEFSSDSTIDARLEKLGNALTTLRSQSSAFGSNLSIVQNRTDFTKSMMNTLRTGADGLTLADMNEEAANLLSLQTRQQLSSTALGLANQADQGVLRLF